jgi:hypothetical protein
LFTCDLESCGGELITLQAARRGFFDRRTGGASAHRILYVTHSAGYRHEVIAFSQAS